jgi:hypothetical protein
MNVSVTFSNLSDRERDVGALILERVNQERILQNQDVFTTLTEWAEDKVLYHIAQEAHFVEGQPGDTRKQLWIQASDEVRAQVDALLGVSV